MVQEVVQVAGVTWSLMRWWGRLFLGQVVAVISRSIFVLNSPISTVSFSMTVTHVMESMSIRVDHLINWLWCPHE